MKVGIITNIKSPYKTLQINEFCKIKNIDITVYYTEPENKKIKWEELEAKFKEVPLKQIKFFSKFNMVFNYGIAKIILENDILIMSGYNQLSVIFASYLCKLFNKPYILLFDGISKTKIIQKPRKNVLYYIKRFVVHGSISIMANGKVSKDYLTEVLKYPEEKIYNQYLSIDYRKIDLLLKNKNKYRTDFRHKYGINKDCKVLLYSGRLIEKKNLERLIRSVALLNDNNITLLFTGGGYLEEKLKKLAQDFNVNLIITGFINIQEELFMHYFAADALILPSVDEPWGLVVNESMAAELPVIVSNICGCVEDLVINDRNGYVIDPKNLIDIKDKVKKLLYNNNLEKMGRTSKEVISNWTFENSKRSLEKIFEEQILIKKIIGEKQ